MDANGLQQVLESIDWPVLLVDAAGRVRYVNSAAAELTGLEAEAASYLPADDSFLVSVRANDGVWHFDGIKKRLQLSPQWRRMFGYPLDEEELDIDWFHLVHPDDMARVQAIMRRHLEGEMPYFESTHRMKHQNG